MATILNTDTALNASGASQAVHTARTTAVASVFEAALATALSGSGDFRTKINECIELRCLPNVSGLYITAIDDFMGLRTATMEMVVRGVGSIMWEIVKGHPELSYAELYGERDERVAEAVSAAEALGILPAWAAEALRA